MDKVLYTLDEVAQATGLSRATLYRLIAEGMLVSLRIGRSRRVSAESLHRFIQVRERETRQRLAGPR